MLPHSTAVGKVLLAWHDEEHVRRVVSPLGLPARTPHTLTSPAAFAAELAAVRRRGWASDEEEELGVRCLAVPVGPGAVAVAAVSVSAPASRLEPGSPEVVAVLLDVADRLAAGLASAVA